MEIEQREFQADINELLNLIIHSFYSNKDVFVRELISNASDALEKQRYKDVQNSKLDKEYEIKIDSLNDRNEIMIKDNGIGMNSNDIIEKLSTIAKSGTKELLKEWQDNNSLIGQFGVGFYSAFLVADMVTLITRKENEEYYRWSSNASQYYTLERIEEVSENEIMEHGTIIYLKLKEECLEYKNVDNLKKILTQYSSFIKFPILLNVEKERKEEKEEEEEEEEEKEEMVVEEEKEKEKKEKEMEIVKYREWERINENIPIWYRENEENTKEEYEILYKSLSGDYDTPLYWRQFKTEGKYEFRGILYIPKKAPFDMMGKHQERRKIKLYVKRVLILEDLERELLPDWMGFITGVIDSSDMPLNVSREILQQTGVVKALKSQLKKQVMNMLSELYMNQEMYKIFYDEFHKNIKLGIHEGDDTLLTYLRLSNSKDDKIIGLENYVNEYLINEEQKNIYYVTLEQEMNHGLVRLYKEKGYTLLYFRDPIDDFMLQRVSKYREYDMINIAKEHNVPWMKTEEEEENESKKQKEEFCNWMKEKINDSDLEKVIISSKLINQTDEPGIIMASKWGWTGSMETIMKSQPLGDSKSMSFMKGRRTLEININHEWIQNLFLNYREENNIDVNKLKIFYYGCLVSGGYPIDNKSDFANSMFNILC